MKIVQVINALDRADAVSQSLLELDRAFREIGWETEIYFEHCHPDFRRSGRSIFELRRDVGDLLLFHYAGYSRILGRVARFSGPRGVVYHNVTPAHFFEDVPSTYEFCRAAIDQLPELPHTFHFGIGDSTFNAEALRSIGFEHTRVLPIAWEASGLSEIEPDSSVLQRHSTGFPLLMVGRAAPHKGLHFAVRALPQVERELGHAVDLLLVGKTAGYETYLAKLEGEIRAAGARGRVTLTSEVSPAALKAYYRRARALLVLSEHEGFCVPIVEAMALGVPVIATRAGATEETLGSGGILLDDRSPETIALAVARAAVDGPARDEILRQQRHRLEAFATRERVKPLARETVEWALSVPRVEVQRSEWPTVSVVICTYNRDWVLERCLRSLRRLDYPSSSYEVVVVNGPSTDRTREILARWPDVRTVETSERNISVSRNLGIATSAGEIVAFIDDDAVADPLWLKALAKAYDDPRVGGAGGVAIGPGGDHLQFANGIISRSGTVVPLQSEPDDRNDPDGPWYNTLMGTNSSFRRSALEAIGGFDENYEYYHDEADVCVRLIQAGHRVAHVPAATVWHGFERSEVRRNPYDIAWRVVVKNTIYFSRCVGQWQSRPWRALLPLRACFRHLEILASWLVRGRIGLPAFARSFASWSTGVAEGYAKSLRTPPRRDLERRRQPATMRPFGREPLRSGTRSLHVALVSQEYPPAPCGGIGVYTESLARGLVEHGHRVTVVTAGEPASIDWQDGVTIYRVPRTEAPSDVPGGLTVTRKNAARSLAVDRVLDWLFDDGVDIVESPIWDAETVATSLSPRVPLVIRMNTPMAIACETQEWARNGDYDLAIDLEWALLRNASGVIDASGTILDTVARKFGVRPSGVPIAEIPFGQPLPELAPAPDANRSGTRFLFLGRLEPRKGIDTLLAALPRVLERCPDAEIDVAGALAEGMRLSDLPAGPRVRFHGAVDDEARAALYAACDVFVAPSRYESFGIVYIEAMSYAKPCIACDAGGPPRILADTGLLVPPGDEGALAEAMIALALDPERRARLGSMARSRIERLYSVEAMVRRTVEFYEEVLSSAARRVA
ncbi:MAG: glycosyltransferase [Deltaproteobacteria bacterium]|nr:glycosyltransferase [Deltaproteobacteria bacterium]